MGILEKQLSQCFVRVYPGEEHSFAIYIYKFGFRRTFESKRIGLRRQPDRVTFFLGVAVEIDGYRQPERRPFLGLLYIYRFCARGGVPGVPDGQFGMSWPVVPLVKEPGKVQTADLFQGKP